MRSVVPKRMMDEAVKFHGHLGPFLVLGLKAGLLANDVLGKDPSKTSAIVETDPVPPCSCIVDGVQVSTGCTMGRGNIELKKGDHLSVTFTKNNRKLKLYLKSDVLEGLVRVSSKDDLKEAALALANRSIRELFEVEEWSKASLQTQGEQYSEKE